MAERSAQMIDPRSAGLRGLELKRPLFDADAIIRADNTLKAIGGSMIEWLDADIERLQQARLAADAAAWSRHSIDPIFNAAHDLKGMGATYGFPIVTQLAASLCRLVETDAGKTEAMRDPALTCAHIDALRAVVRDDVRDTKHVIGAALLRALEQKVESLGVAPR